MFSKYSKLLYAFFFAKEVSLGSLSSSKYAITPFLSRIVILTFPSSLNAGSLRTSRPLWNNIKVGSCEEDVDLSIANCSANSGYSSKSTTPNSLCLLLNSTDNCAKTGSKKKQSGHHDAQNATIQDLASSSCDTASRTLEENV